MDALPPDLARLRPRGDTLYINCARLVLATSVDGWIDASPDHGLFLRETRLLSRYACTIDGVRPATAGYSNLDQRRAAGYFIARPPGAPAEPADRGSGHLDNVTQRTLEVRLLRKVGDTLRDDLTITNYSLHDTHFVLALTFDADFADLSATRDPRAQAGRCVRRWIDGADGPAELRFDYHAESDFDHQGEHGHAEIHRGVIIRFERPDSPAVWSGANVSFDIALPPRGCWRARLTCVPTIDGVSAAIVGADALASATVEDGYDARRQAFLTSAATCEAPGSGTRAAVVTAAFAGARQDLASLRLYDLDRGTHAWVPAAGLPLYVALFGRDVLTSGWQAALVSPDPLRGSLLELARWQGRASNPWRDEEPGRLIHEAHTGPLSALNVNPRARYYGSATTSSFFAFTLAEYWHWTGDRALVQSLLPTALDALAAVDKYGDMDRDGFYEYRTASTDGVRNQGWKDSGDAIVYADGRQVDAPIATCEEQAFVYVAKQYLAEVLCWFGDEDQARRLWREAAELKKWFNDTFWMEDQKFVALGLDARKHRITSIASNAGHCLAAGIIDTSRAQRVAERLMAPDLFSGWGVRTLSANHPAYNPYSYHRGSVWPVENGTFALAFLRYGLHDHLERLCRALFDAAVLFDHYRLPELFAGHQRDDDTPIPALYPQANSPQAWSSSAVFSLVQAMLGIYPYAPLHLLLIDPRLPPWLPELTVRDIAVGDGRASLRFTRDGASGHTGYEVLDLRGPLHVIRQPSPWSLTAGPGERLVDALRSLVPA